MGDRSQVFGSDTQFRKTKVPARAQAAHQQASTVAKSIQRFLDKKKPLIYCYRDYGSLVSLSTKGAVGQLMGCVTHVMIERKIARLVYLSLYKQHQIKLHGWWRVVMLTIANILTRHVKPRLKLH